MEVIARLSIANPLHAREPSTNHVFVLARASFKHTSHLTHAKTDGHDDVTNTYRHKYLKHTVAGGDG